MASPRAGPCSVSVLARRNVGSQVQVLEYSFLCLFRKQGLPRAVMATTQAGKRAAGGSDVVGLSLIAGGRAHEWENHPCGR